jgi:hypothetical protein
MMDYQTTPTRHAEAISSFLHDSPCNDITSADFSEPGSDRLRWLLRRPGQRVGMFLPIRKTKKELTEHRISRMTKCYPKRLNRYFAKWKGESSRKLDLIVTLVPGGEYRRGDAHLHLDIALPPECGMGEFSTFCQEHWLRYDFAAPGEAYPLENPDDEWMNRLATLESTQAYRDEYDIQPYLS